MSCTISYRVSNQSELDFWSPAQMIPVSTHEKITMRMNSDGIFTQPVSSSRQERTITPSLMKPQAVQPICLNTPQ